MSDIFGLGSITSGVLNMVGQWDANRSNLQAVRETNAANTHMQDAVNIANTRMNDATNKANAESIAATNASNRAMNDASNAANIAITNNTNAANRAMNEATNKANAQSIAETNAQNYAIFQQTNQREDTAVQRRVADLTAAGLSPTLAAGSAASTGAPITLQAARANPGHDENVRVSASRDVASQANPGRIEGSRNMAAHVDPVQVADIALAISQANKNNAEARRTNIEADKTDAGREFWSDNERLNAAMAKLDAEVASDPEVGKRAMLIFDKDFKNIQSEYTKQLTETEKAKLPEIEERVRGSRLANDIQEKFGFSNAEMDNAIKSYAVLEAKQNWNIQNQSGVPTNRETTESERFWIWVMTQMGNYEHGIYQGGIETFYQIGPWHASFAGLGIGGPGNTDFPKKDDKSPPNSGPRPNAGNKKYPEGAYYKDGYWRDKNGNPLPYSYQ